MVKLDSVIFDFYDQVNFYIFRLILWYFCSYLIVLSMKLRYCLGGPGGCVGLGGPIGLVGLVGPVSPVSPMDLLVLVGPLDQVSPMGPLGLVGPVSPVSPLYVCWSGESSGSRESRGL